MAAAAVGSDGPAVGSMGRIATRIFGVALTCALAAFAGCSQQPAAPARAALDKIENIIVIYLENRSFDNLYGCRANGVTNALASAATYQQLDRDGLTVLPKLPPVWAAGGSLTWSFVADLPNRPFRIDAANGNSPAFQCRSSRPTSSHKLYPKQEQIDGGKNDRFAAGIGCGRPDDGVLRRLEAAAMEVGAGVHAGRQFFHGRFWRFLPQSLLADLRVHARRLRNPRRGAGAARLARGLAQAQARVACRSALEGAAEFGARGITARTAIR